MVSITKVSTRLFKFLSFLELTLLLLGVSLPIAAIDEFWFFSSEFSVISLIQILFIHQEYILATIILIFGLMFPILKILQKHLRSKAVTKLPLYKFSMLDIFLLSFLIYGGKLSYFYDVELQIGFYIIVSSIVLSYLTLIIPAHDDTRSGK